MDRPYDAVIVGSGFGGAMVAHALVQVGQRVLLVERGSWAHRGPACWAPCGTLELSPFWSTESPYRVLAGRKRTMIGTCSCVGGPSVFYGGVALRLRESDFQCDAEIGGGPGACFPFDYSELEPHYTQAERILDVAGKAGEDPTEPPRSAPYPQAPAALSPTAARIRDAAAALGLRPFRLPLAIHNAASTQRARCVACGTCDTFACAINAKNDLATVVLPGLIEAGLELVSEMVATRVLVERGRAVGVVCHDKAAGRSRRFFGRRVILSAGALGSAHLLLASNLERRNPAEHAVGHYLTRHCSAIVLGLFPWRPAGDFHKQIGIHDFYLRGPAARAGRNRLQRLGSVQQVSTPPVALLLRHAPRLARGFIRRAVAYTTGLLVIAEDQPRRENGVAVDWGIVDRFGLPQLTITHRHTPRDEAARAALVREARAILRVAGAAVVLTHRIATFSHALGTARMGDDPRASPLTRDCEFRGVEGLYVVDGSCLPRSGAVNPSLTIAANALRVGERLARA